MFWAKLYREVYSDDNLTEAWHRVRANGSTPGVDGVTIPQFQRRLFSNLKAIQRDLEKKRYTPQPAKRTYISKPDGSKRPLGILTVRDRIVQRAVLNVIELLFEPDFTETSYAFRPGRSVDMALDHVARLADQGYEWAVELDVEDYFESIDLRRLYSLIARRVKDRELRRIIRSWLAAEMVTVRKNGVFKREEGRGLLQGGIISPLFANIYLDRFDKLAAKKGLQAIRYADDILILCRAKRQARTALKTAQKILARIGLSINPYKVQVVHLEKGLNFLGETIFLQGGAAQGEGRLVRLTDGGDIERSGGLPNTEMRGDAEDEPMESLTFVLPTGNEEEEDEHDLYN